MGKYREKLNPDQEAQMIKIIMENASLLTQMIEDLLILSRIESKKLPLKWGELDLIKIIHDTVNQIQPKQVLKNISIELEVPEKLSTFGDSTRLLQVFRNLLDNAIKYSHNGTNVKINAFDHYLGPKNPTGVDGILIQIIDNGIGINPKDISHMFERFYRSIDVQEVQGTGLGLSIAKELIELHMGKISFDTEYGKGSTFSVFLPRITNQFLNNNL